MGGVVTFVDAIIYLDVEYIAAVVDQLYNCLSRHQYLHNYDWHSQMPELQKHSSNYPGK